MVSPSLPVTAVQVASMPSFHQRMERPWLRANAAARTVDVFEIYNHSIKFDTVEVRPW